MSSLSLLRASVSWRCRLTTLAALLSAFAMLAIAQFNCSIQGIVTDPSGAVVSDASVQVTNMDTGIKRDANSSSDGLYRVLSLPPGRYQVEVAAKGFRSMARRDILVGTPENVRVDFSLQVGADTQSVTVVATESGVETETASNSSVLTQKVINDIPVNGNNVYELLALQPGVTGRAFSYSGGANANAPFGSHPTVQIYASGARGDSNSFMVDGASASGVADGGTVVIQPNPDSVEELKVNTNTYSTEYGRNSGAQVEVVTKGGTNQFHGAAFENFTNNTLSARNEFTASLSPFRRNQFGYDFGGPIKKNRLFFFTSYDGLRAGGGQASVATVETQQFAEWVEQTYPNTIAAKLFKQFQPISYATYNFKNLGTPLVGNPTTSVGPSNGILTIGSVNYVPNVIYTGNQFSGRTDFDVRPGKDRLFLNYYNMHSEQLSGGARPAFNRPEDDFDELLSFNETHIFTPSLLNEFKFGLNRTVAGSVYPPNLQVPTISIGGGVTGFGLSGQFPAGWFQSEFTYKDGVSWVHSSHSFKFGAEVRREWANSHQTTTYVPQYTFNSILNFAVDAPATEVQLVDPRTGLPGTLVLGMRALDIGLYFNDNWKVARNLTISYGVRYERFGTWTEVNNLLRNMVLGPGSSYTQQLANASMQFVPQLYSTPNKDFMPRFGFAWNPDGKGKTSIRGGYGVYFDRIYSTPVINIRSNPPYRGLATSGYQFGTQVYYGLGDGTGAGFPVDPDWQLGLDSHNGIKGSRVGLLQIVDPNISEPYTENWSFGVQRQINWGVVIEANYLGSAGHHLLNTLDVNRFNGDLLTNGQFHGYNQSFAAMPLAETTSNSIYNGGTIQVRRPFGRGFSVQGAFTYGKVLSDNDAFGGITAYVDANNRKLNRGLASYDVPKRLTLASSWSIPFFKDQRRIEGRILGGWQLTGTGIFDAGTPLTVTSSATYPKGDWNADGTANDRPNAPLSPLAAGGYSRSAFLTGFLSASAFPSPALGTDGTLGRSTYFGPGFAQVDLSLQKRFAITERTAIQFRANAYNAFNRVNLNNPTMDLNSSNFGRSTSQQIPRAIEGVLRFVF
jgi:hypothetical protein